MPCRINCSLLLLVLSVALLSAPLAVVGFAPSAALRPRSSTAFAASGSRSERSGSPSSTRIQSSPAETAEKDSSLAPSSSAEAQDDADDDEEEWEYVEFENLTEEDFYNSEWKVGTVWEDRPNDIKETWVRLIVQEGEGPGSSAKNVAIWGDGGKGRWSIDVASQFFSISKESFGGWLGKRIWAGEAEDYYYLQGTVRGWSPISPASVLGQWQMKRLGVSEEEAGVAPWFEEEEMSIQEIKEDVPTEEKETEK